MNLSFVLRLQYLHNICSFFKRRTNNSLTGPPPVVALYQSIFQSVYGNSSFDGDRYLCGQSKNPACCSCEKNCLERRSCCVDYIWKEKSNLETNKCLKHFVTIASRVRRVTCQKIVQKPLPVNAHRFVFAAYYMIKDCPYSTEKPLKQVCENPANLLISSVNPVYDRKGYLYFDKFCAKCNGVNDYRMLKLKVDCYKDSLFQEKRTSGNFSWFGDKEATNISCYVALTFPRSLKSEVYSCKYRLDICSKDSQFYSLCREIGGEFVEYKNYFCAVCYYEILQNKRYTFSTMPSFKMTCSIKTNRIGDGSLKISYSDLLDTSQNEEKPKTCHKGQVYNILTGKCETIKCPLDMSKCTETTTSQSNVRVGTSCSFQFLIANANQNMGKKT